MQIDQTLGSDLSLVPIQSAAAEKAGYAGLVTAETSHDPFFPLLVASQHTERVDLITAIAVAFARNPMTLAQTANDLQLASDGRFMMGLGSQIKPHITRRFSMPWSHPAPRMREFILAMRAIWDCWNEGSKLDFDGEFYSHTLMTPFFNPGPNPHGPPRVLLAAVGERMTEVAGEVCDGMLVHPFTTERYLSEVTRPALERGAERAGGGRGRFELSLPAFVVLGEDDDEIEVNAKAVKGQIAFYGSTPAYRPVLELHGWGELQPELNSLSKAGRWTDMADAIDDEVLHTIAVVGDGKSVAEGLRARYSGTIDRLSFYAPYGLDPKRWVPIIDALGTA